MPDLWRLVLIAAGGFNKMKKIIFFLIAAISILGCEKKGLELHITFDLVQGLKQTDSVIFQQNKIGNVVRVTYTDQGNYAVDIIISESFSAAATEYSRFLIVTDPADEARKAIEIIQIRKDGRMLNDGETVEGSSRASAIIEEFKDRVETGTEDLKKSFHQLLDELSHIPESEEFKSFKNELDQLINDLKRSGQSAGEKFQRDVLPRLQQELETFRKHLEELNRRQESSPPENRNDDVKQL